jgi:hypothetical protein
MMLNFNRKPIHSEKRIDSEQNAPLFLTRWSNPRKEALVDQQVLEQL